MFGLCPPECPFRFLCFYVVSNSLNQPGDLLLAEEYRNQEESGPVMTVMRSLSSGYITMKGNLSHDGTEVMYGYLPIPNKHTVMLHLKQMTPRSLSLTLYRHFEQFDWSAKTFREMKTVVWDRFVSANRDLVYLCNTTKLSIKVWRNSCIMTECFQIFFSFFPERKAPQRLPNGLWNCSAEDYFSFRQHVECSLKTECEDGRDEAGHCPFSSPDCQGMIAMCGRCYRFVRNLPGLKSDRVDINSFMNEHCGSLGGTVGVPLCVFDWFGIVFNLSGILGVKLSNFGVGRFSNDMLSVPMYRHEAFQGRVVLYHSFRTAYTPVHHIGDTLCYVSAYYNFMHYKRFTCILSYRYIKTISGMVCSFMTNRTDKQSYDTKPISLNNAQFVLPWRCEHTTLCHGGHVTYKFLLCGSHQLKVCSQESTFCYFHYRTLHKKDSHSVDEHTELVPTFKCYHDITTLSYTLVCDFIHNCQDGTDESFCKHPVCVNMFTCSNGQCLTYTKVCDQTPNCHDHSEEHSCRSYRTFLLERPFFPSPAQVDFNGVRNFKSTPMYLNESCPDSHYRCPGDFNDCLPVYTRCNGIYDCMDRKDEDGCADMLCPGFFRCRASTTCLHPDHLCDGWPHCPMNDDEIVCGSSCPVGCLCQGHSFLCHQPFSTIQFPYIRSLDGTSSGITLSDVSHLHYLVLLVLAQCSLTILPTVELLNLRFLDLSKNKLKQLNTTALMGLYNLQALSLSQNPINTLHTDLSSVLQHNNLLLVDLSFTALTVFDSRVFSPFAFLQKLNLTFTGIDTITSSGFQFTPQLTELYMDDSPVTTFSLNLFKDLSRLCIVSTDNYKLCCKRILPDQFEEASCHAPRDEISSCDDLIQSWFYRGFLWFTACLSMSGNVFCFCTRLISKSMSSSSGFSVFVLNLTLADFLMCIYIAIVGVADEQFRGRYLQLDDTWKNSITCKVAGSLCLLSSEVSALVIWLITLDRFLALHFPFSTLRFGRRSAAVVCLLTWSIGWILALLPSLPMLSHWEFYSQTGICIPLPVTKQDFEGKEYSFSLLIVLNFILFSFISVGQALIYWSIQNNAFKTNTTKVSRDMTIAQRLITVVVTDFMCWFPIGLCGMLALTGMPIPGEVNVALAVFILPLNSAINPFMYTFNTLAEKRRQSNETKLLQWLESYS